MVSPRIRLLFAPRHTAHTVTPTYSFLLEVIFIPACGHRRGGVSAGQRRCKPGWECIAVHKADLSVVRVWVLMSCPRPPVGGYYSILSPCLPRLSATCWQTTGAFIHDDSDGAKVQYKHANGGAFFIYTSAWGGEIFESDNDFFCQCCQLNLYKARPNRSAVTTVWSRRWINTLVGSERSAQVKPWRLIKSINGLLFSL